MRTCFGGVIRVLGKDPTVRFFLPRHIQFAICEPVVVGRLLKHKMTSAVKVPPNLTLKKRQLETKKARDKVLKTLHFSVGDRVEATNGQEWGNDYYPGVVTDINTSDCTCTIKFDDNDFSGAINLKCVRRLFKVHKRRLTLKSEEEQKKLLVDALQQRSNRKKKLLQRKYTAFQLLEAAVIVIQAYARGYYARKYLIKRQKAALLLIYRYRRYKAEQELARRKKIKSLGPRGGMYLNINKACKKIVHIFRLAKGKGDARRRKKWIVTMQSLLRRWLWRHKYYVLINGFTLIQSYQRMRTCRKSFLLTRAKIIMLQANIRSFETRLQYNKSQAR